MDGYDLSHPRHTKEEDSIGKYIRHLFGQRLPGVNESLVKLLGVYRTIVTHANNSPKHLRARLTEGGKPLFTLDEIKQIQEVVKTQLNTPYARRLRGMKGGVAPKAAAPATGTTGTAGTAVAPVAAAPGNPLYDKFWDKLIRTKIVEPIGARIPACWAQYDWIPFALYYMEKFKLVGPLLSTFLDSVSLSLPVLASLASEMVATVVALAPVPYASFVGDAVGYAVAFLLISLAVTINVSRKYYGSAFQASLEVIPFIGEVLSEGAQKFELGVERYLINRDKITKGIEEVTPTGARAITYYTPGWDAYTGKAPSVSLDGLGRNVATYVAEQLPSPPTVPSLPGASTALSSLPGASTALSSLPGASTALSSLPGASTVLPSLPTVSGNAVTAATAVTSSVVGKLPTLPTITPPSLPKGGTRRRSRRVSKRKNTRRK